MGNFTVMHYLHMLADNCISGNPTLILSSCLVVIVTILMNFHPTIVWLSSPMSLSSNLRYHHSIPYVTFILSILSLSNYLLLAPNLVAVLLGLVCYLQLWWCYFFLFRTEVGKWEVRHFPVDVPQTQGAQTQVQK